MVKPTVRYYRSEKLWIKATRCFNNTRTWHIATGMKGNLISFDNISLPMSEFKTWLDIEDYVQREFKLYSDYSPYTVEKE